MKDANDLLQRGVDPLSVPAEDVARTHQGPEAPAGGGPVAVPWNGEDPGWWTEPAPLREWLVRAGPDEHSPGYLPRGEVGILAGKGAAGKTWAAVALALAVATGRPWLGCRVSPKSGRVAFLAAEEDGTELRRRFQAQAAMMGIPLATLAGRVLVLDRKGVDIHQEGPALVGPLVPMGWGPSQFGRSLLMDLTRRAEVAPWDLVVLDPLSAFGSVDAEKDAAAATATMREVERLCGLPGGPLVLVAHHTKKPSGGGKDAAADSDDIRGSSGIVNRARWAAILEGVPVPDENEAEADGRRFLRLSVVKGNYSPSAPPLVYVQPPLLSVWRDGQQQPARGAIRAVEPDELRIIGKKVKPKQQADVKTSGKGRSTDGT